VKVTTSEGTIFTMVGLGEHTIRTTDVQAKFDVRDADTDAIVVDVPTPPGPKRLFVAPRRVVAGGSVTEG
jgi:hypothetical protein